MSRPLDPVQDAELLTKFLEDHTVHVYTAPETNGQVGAVVREEHWKQHGGVIGSGAFGSVWLERCVKGLSSSHWRAIKRVSKSSQTSEVAPVDYRRELEAIVKFSQEKYEQFFVKSFGWYQNESSIYIAMEYLEHGNLHEHLDQNPCLNETDAQHICFQILNGLKIMHENSYSHRDVKPANILIKSKPPDPWHVKLGDFGFSKRAEDNNMTTSTIRQGTLRYMAPELLDYVDIDRRSLMRDARAADIWAVGEVVFQMLTRQPAFRTTREMLTYVAQPETFPSIFLQYSEASASAINFIERLMRPRPEKRLTAAVAMTHKWLEAAYVAHVARSTAAFPEQQVSGGTYLMAPPSSVLQIPRSVSAPSAQWSAVSMIVPLPSHDDPDSRLKRSDPANATVVKRAQSKNDSNSIAATTTTVSYTEARYFIIKSSNETNVESSIARGVWASNKANNTQLTKAYNATNGEIFLIFSVNKSRKFCGVAAMRSPWKAGMTNPDWRGGVWEGGFLVEWLSQIPVNFDDVRHLKHKADGISITLTRFMTELCSSTGHQMMQRFGLVDGASVTLSNELPSRPLTLTQPRNMMAEPMSVAKTPLELEVLFCRHKLQQGLLSCEQPPDERQMPSLSSYIRYLETKSDMPRTVLKATKIHKVLKSIVKMRSIPREEEFHLRRRSLQLMHKWSKTLSDEKDEVDQIS